MKTKNLPIIRETEKAVLVHASLNAQWFDGNEPRFDKDVWMPKSQIKIEAGNVVEVADWFARKTDINAKLHDAEYAGKAQGSDDKYAAVIERAKAAGIKGIRKGMKYATILTKAAEQGIAFAI